MTDQTLQNIEQQVVDEKRVEELAEQKAGEKVSQLQNNLLKALGQEPANEWEWEGKDALGRPAPKDWNEAPNKIVNRAVNEAEKRIEEKLRKEREESEQKAQTDAQTRAKTEEQKAQEEYNRISDEWKELVSDGELPDISQEVKDKLSKGVGYDQLSEDEKKDPGLVAWNEVKALHAVKMREGQSHSLARTVNKFYKKRPSGVNAPVAGATPGSSVEDEEIETLDETRNRRKRWFGW